MNKKYISLLSLIFIFLVVFGGTLLYLNRQKPIETKMETLEDGSEIEVEVVTHKVQGKAVCIADSGEIVSINDGVDCSLGIETTDSKLYLFTFPSDPGGTDTSIFEKGEKIKTSGKIVKYEDDVLESLEIDTLEVVK